MQGRDRHIATIVEVDVQLMTPRADMSVIGRSDVIFAPSTRPDVKRLKRRGAQELSDLFDHRAENGF